MPAIDRGTFERFTRSIDPIFVEEALAESVKATVRRRRLPSDRVLWLVLGMALFRNEAIEQVVRTLELALPGRKGVTRGAIAQARERLGSEPMRWLFTRTSQEWSAQSADRHRWRGLALYGVDGTTVRVPDSPSNRAEFGGQSAGERRGESGYPLVRLVTLMVLRSHLLAGARLGPYGTSELEYAKELWPLVPDNSLVCVDRGFLSAAVLHPLHATAANRHWLTRARSTTKWRLVKELGPNDLLVELDVSREARRRSPELPETWTVRAIRYERRGFPPQTLLTSMLEPAAFPAKEIVALYHERWEIELGYDEVKTELLEREEAIRSQKPDGVRQELWGVALAYNLIRLEMERTALELKVAPTRISFVAALWTIRNELRVAAYASPGTLPKRLDRLRSQLAEFVLPPRRSGRTFPRAVKRKMSNYSRKRPTTT